MAKSLHLNNNSKMPQVGTPECNNLYKKPNNWGTLTSEADLRPSILSSLNSGYFPCQLMSPEERNELMGGTEVCLMGTRVSP